jgi:hypothetical protein
MSRFLSFSALASVIPCNILISAIIVVPRSVRYICRRLGCQGGSQTATAGGLVTG